MRAEGQIRGKERDMNEWRIMLVDDALDSMRELRFGGKICSG
jgi:hypothetical protein